MERGGDVGRGEFETFSVTGMLEPRSEKEKFYSVPKRRKKLGPSSNSWLFVFQLKDLLDFYSVLRFIFYFILYTYFNPLET